MTANVPDPACAVEPVPNMPGLSIVADISAIAASAAITAEVITLRLVDISCFTSDCIGSNRIRNRAIERRVQPVSEVFKH